MKEETLAKNNSKFEFVEEVPQPRRSSVSEETLNALKANPGKFAIIARQGDDGMTESTARSRGVSLIQYAERRGVKDKVETAERTIDGVLYVYACWVDK